MQRKFQVALFKREITPSTTKNSSLTVTPKKSNKKRLEEIEYDFDAIPHLFCDVVTQELLEKPLMIDIQHHVIDECNLESHTHYEKYSERFEGKHINPLNMESSILTPQTFNAVTQDLQKKLRAILHKALSFQDGATDETEAWLNQALDLNTQLTGYQQKLLEQLINQLAVGQNITENEKLKKCIEGEIKSIDTNFERFDKEEKIRSENQTQLEEQIETFISFAIKINRLKKKLAEIPGKIEIAQATVRAFEEYKISAQETHTRYNHLQALLNPMKKINTEMQEKEIAMMKKKSFAPLKALLKKQNQIKQKLYTALDQHIRNTLPLLEKYEVETVLGAEIQLRNDLKPAEPAHPIIKPIWSPGAAVTLFRRPSFPTTTPRPNLSHWFLMPKPDNHENGEKEKELDNNNKKPGIQ